jgi:hypothetical protein
MPPRSPLIKRAKPTSFEQRHMKNEIAVIGRRNRRPDMETSQNNDPLSTLIGPVEYRVAMRHLIVPMMFIALAIVIALAVIGASH